MALRSLIGRLVLAGRNALTRRRRFLDLEGLKNKKIDDNNQVHAIVPSSFNPNRVYMYNIDRARIHKELYGVLDANVDEETIRCDEFVDEDAINAAKFADECTATSYKFADEDTINVAKLADKDTIICAKFAVDEIARAKETNIEFVRVLRSSRMASWTRDYQIILEAVNKDTGEKSLYYAQVQANLCMDEKPFKLVTWMSK